MTDLHEADIWQEGADDRECCNCGGTIHSCICYEKECTQCMRVIDPTIATQWNGKWYCDDNCLTLFIN
ncbi:hypothetical protein LCGC14_0463560 [marine sediment metagenome]|uniref:Uncharacterized protein n=1 Tax=marine sediment metagenome TaxID=412755 RepID=A0A0F9VN05_9ZZZZ